MSRAHRLFAICALGALGVSACAGPQSALDPAGREAARLADLFWLLSAGALLIWVVAVALWMWAVRGAPQPRAQRWRPLILVGGGVAVPVIALAGVLAYSLAMLPDVLEPAPEGGLRIEVVGHQWWWRVRYLPVDGEPIELANEVRLPVGERIQLELESRDVIHSFWLPTIAGKIDMIPGRRTRLALEPTRPGVYRGACAEYCGASHALMSLAVVVQEPEEFGVWLAGQVDPAREPATRLGARGQQVFLTAGCGACHTVRGTPADGVLGPDLTHVGSRLSLGAGTLPNDVGAFRRFIAETEEVKPSVHMPAFGMLPSEDLDALAAYLEELL